MVGVVSNTCPCILWLFGAKTVYNFFLCLDIISCRPFWWGDSQQKHIYQAWPFTKRWSVMNFMLFSWCVPLGACLSPCPSIDPRMMKDCHSIECLWFILLLFCQCQSVRKGVWRWVTVTVSTVYISFCSTKINHITFLSYLMNGRLLYSQGLNSIALPSKEPPTTEADTVSSVHAMHALFCADKLQRHSTTELFS